MMAFSSEIMKHWSEEIEVNGVTIKFKLDKGADMTVIGDSIYSHFFSKTNLLIAHKKLFGPVKANFTVWVYYKQNCD